MNGSVKLSIIIPVYNSAGYLHECLDSVLGQSLADIEVICVDDGSTDNSVEILNEYAKRDERLSVILQDNLHAGPARNAGIEAASGEYLHFLDSDDYVLDYAYEALYNKAKKYDLDVLRFANLNWDTQLETYIEDSTTCITGFDFDIFDRYILPESEDALFHISVAPWAGIYKRSFIIEKNIRFNNLICCNDRSFYNAVITNAKKIMITRDRLVVYRTNQEKSLIGTRAKHFDCHFRSIEIAADRLVKDGVDPELQKKVLSKEFGDLFNWFKKYCDDSELGKSIAEQTAEFVSSYKRPFGYILKNQYNNALKALNKSSASEKNKKPMSVEYKKSDYPKVSVIVPVCADKDTAKTPGSFTEETGAGAETAGSHAQSANNFIGNTINSLTSQTLADMEFLFITNEDCHEEINSLKAAQNTDKRFSIIPFAGTYGQKVNAGISAARGSYIAILNPGDYAQADMYAGLYSAALQSSADFAASSFRDYKKNPSGISEIKKHALTYDKSIYGRVICPRKNNSVLKFPVIVQNGLYKKSFIDGAGIRYSETAADILKDKSFWIKVIYLAERAYFVDKPYYTRFVPGSGLAYIENPQVFFNEYDNIEKFLSFESLPEDAVSYFYAGKFDSSISYASRLPAEYKEEFLRSIQLKFILPLERGLIKKECMLHERQWYQLNQIVQDPAGYCGHICVSVIMPVYNAEKYLRRALDSILMNTLQFEVICVDDGSSDSSLQILNEYAKKDPRIIVIEQGNSGAGAARNNALGHVHGEYIAFMDSDDFAEPQMLDIAYYEARRLDTDVTVFRSDRYVDETGKFRASDYTIKKNLLPAKQPFDRKDIKNDVFNVFVGHPWDKIYKTEFIKENNIRFLEIQNTEDVYFVFLALMKAERISVIEKKLIHNRMHAGSLSMTLKEDGWECFYTSMCSLRSRLKEWGIYDELEQDFINDALGRVLRNLYNARGEIYRRIYGCLKGGWLEDLGLTDKKKSYFYDEAEYDRLQEILEFDADEFLFRRIDSITADYEFQKSRANKANNQLSEEKRRTAAARAEYYKISSALSGYVTARLDIKNEGRRENNIVFSDLDGVGVSEEIPEWFSGGNGIGHTIRAKAEADKGKFSFRMHCIKNGTLQISMKGQHFKRADKSNIPYWIDYTSLKINGQEVLEEPVYAWHDNPYYYRKPVKDNEILDVVVEFKSHAAGRQIADEKIRDLAVENISLKDRLGKAAEEIKAKAAQILDADKKIKDSEEKISALNGQLSEANKANENIKKQFEAAKEENNALKAKLSSAEKENKTLKAKADDLGYRLDETRKSKTYKIGCAITWLPRKLKGN